MEKPINIKTLDLIWNKKFHEDLFLPKLKKTFSIIIGEDKKEKQHNKKHDTSFFFS